MHLFITDTPLDQYPKRIEFCCKAMSNHMFSGRIVYRHSGNARILGVPIGKNNEDMLHLGFCPECGKEIYITMVPMDKTDG